MSEELGRLFCAAARAASLTSLGWSRRVRIRRDRIEAAEETPRSAFMLPRWLPLASHDLLDCAMTLVDRNVGVSVAIGVGIGNVNPSERLAANHARPLGIGPVRIRGSNSGLYS